MAKSDARFEYKAGLSRTDHELSQPFTFTSASGMLLPIWSDIASPGDSYYMQHDMPLLRSVVLASPAMVDVKVHYETFFVPFQMIYQPIEQTKFSINNLQSSLYNIQDLMNNNFPLLDYSSQLATLTGLTTSARCDAFRLADLFGLEPLNLTGSSNPYGFAPYAPNFFPWQLLAYHTIFQYYYRLDDKSQFDNSYCNWDSYYSSSTVTPNVSYFWQIHQRPWNFDYFISMYRSPIVSNQNLQGVLSSGIYSDLVDAAGRRTSPVANDGSSISTNASIRAFSNEIGTPFAADWTQSGFSSALIRQVFANEKLAMITGRTRKNYDSQVLAHYGVSVPHDVKHDITMIHHDEYNLNVLEVTSLASTSDAPLGELAGKSYATGNGKSFKFTAPCDGVIMTIFSIEPIRKYQASFDRINAISDIFDLPTPEFDRLGNVPMYRYECGTRYTTPQTLTPTDIIGWKERYYPFKRKHARATLAFMNPQTTQNTWSSYVLSSHPFASPAIINIAGTIQQYIYPRPDIESSFYIDRGAMDQLCLVPFVNSWIQPDEGETGEDWRDNPHLLYSRDPFIVDSHIKCKKVSWMSKDGEPIYPF